MANNHHMEGWVQNCSNSIANALELLESCTKPSIYLLDLLELNNFSFNQSCDSVGSNHPLTDGLLSFSYL